MSAPILRALRGAVSIPADTAEEIKAGTAELLQEMLDRNGLVADDLVSIIFTATRDLSAEFPAVAAREMGLATVPLLCAREIPVVGSLPSCVRVMIHCYADPDRPPQHVYLRDAKQLRDDLPG